MSAKVLVPRDNPGTHRAVQVAPKNTYFTHIDGLRGFALALVVIFHVFVGKVSSGVDIFLFIGGLLFVASQSKNALNPQGLSFIQSVIRIMRRLYPALIAVVSVATVATLATSPPAQWLDMLRHASAAATYRINWVFIDEGSSYARAGAQADVFQHLWSMAVQVQIYILLLVVITAIAVVMQRRKSATTVINVTVAIMTIASFSYAVYLNQTDQQKNYYDTFTRFWEIGLGSLVGIYLMNRVVLSPILRWIAASVGTVLILGTGIVLNGVQQFPGAWTLVPLLGAALVIFSGTTNPLEEVNWKTMGVVSIFSTRPLLFLGKISYSLYLWHWVLLILSQQVDWTPDNIWITGSVVIALSIAMAWLTYTYIETPLRQKKKPQRATIIDMVRGKSASGSRRGVDWGMRLGASTVALLVATVAFSPTMFHHYQRAGQSEQERRIDDLGGFEVAYPGAMALANHTPTPDGVTVTPNPDDGVDVTFPQSQGDECYVGFEGADPVLTNKDGKPCAYGDTDSKDTFYVLGGSHSEMYLPALDTIGKNRHFKVIPIIKMGCAFYQDTKWDGSHYDNCAEFTDKSIQYVLDNPPTIGVFHTATRPENITGSGKEMVPPGYVGGIKRISDAGIPTFLIRDIPWGTTEDGGFRDIKLCVSDARLKGKDVSECGENAADSLQPVNPAIAAYAGIKNVTLLDPTPGMIDEHGRVQPVVGNVLVYRDSHHITNTFAQSLTPMLDQQMFGDRQLHPAG